MTPHPIGAMEKTALPAVFFFEQSIPVPDLTFCRSIKPNFIAYLFSGRRSVTKHLRGYIV